MSASSLSAAGRAQRDLCTQCPTTPSTGIGTSATRASTPSAKEAAGLSVHATGGITSRTWRSGRALSAGKSVPDQKRSSPAACVAQMLQRLLRVALGNTKMMQRKISAAGTAAIHLAVCRGARPAKIAGVSSAVQRDVRRNPSLSTRCFCLRRWKQCAISSVRSVPSFPSVRNVGER